MFSAGYQPVFEFPPGYPRCRYVSPEELASIFTPGHGIVRRLAFPIAELEISPNQLTREGPETELWVDDTPPPFTKPQIDVDLMQYAHGDLSVLEAHCEFLGRDCNPSLAAALQVRKESMRLAKQRRSNRKRKLTEMRQRKPSFRESQIVTPSFDFKHYEQLTHGELYNENDDDIPLTSLFLDKYGSIKHFPSLGISRNLE